MADTDSVDLGGGWVLGPYAAWARRSDQWLHVDGRPFLFVSDDVAAMLRTLAARLAEANEQLMARDANDAFDPAYYRGSDAATYAVTDIIRKVLDGKDDGAGVNGYEPLHRVRRDILALKARLADAEAERDALVDDYARALIALGAEHAKREGANKLTIQANQRTMYRQRQLADAEQRIAQLEAALWEVENANNEHEMREAIAAYRQKALAAGSTAEGGRA